MEEQSRYRLSHTEALWTIGMEKTHRIELGRKATGCIIRGAGRGVGIDVPVELLTPCRRIFSFSVGKSESAEEAHLARPGAKRC